MSLKEDDPLALYVISTTQPEAVARRILLVETAVGGAADPDADPELLVEVACLAAPAEGVPWR